MCEPVLTRGGAISTNRARVKEIPPCQRVPLALAGGDFFARGTIHLGSAAPVHLGFAPFADFAAPIHLGFASFADFAAEGVRVASV